MAQKLVQHLALMQLLLLLLLLHSGGGGCSSAGLDLDAGLETEDDSAAVVGLETDKRYMHTGLSYCTRLCHYNFGRHARCRGYFNSVSRGCDCVCAAFNGWGR
ncbi:hypothetical protein BOX15_Mlig002610g1 [Macrostomum lignano]|uniref:Invertebrate defensins family profile domain-containing protein n=1 Tax=Macrostomum lignano TaxID=282301 RepID=A0A267EUX9_9PLAT|nr:hypothetical protein BOX15_Mlig002610g3 [Macrostomum lignano]PAA65225.1 hypothetical protein BOX15_Mlig002610g2 [Macrostomum lignano]PAA71963.1 hypothetical protein BOX15_Mlig002610g1 [Macrostomum lignano]